MGDFCVSNFNGVTTFSFRVPSEGKTDFVQIDLAKQSLSDDLVVPLTGGIEFNFKTVDRVILEAEYVSNRYDHKDFVNFKSKHTKDVLGALYLEKALTDRFSLSAGFHNYGASRDFMLSGNLIGRIN